MPDITPVPILIRSGTSGLWSSVNPVLRSVVGGGTELGLETDTGKMKAGDSVTPWNSLPYISGGGISGYSGFSGYAGTSGASGIPGIDGLPGTSGASGISGWSGFSGKSGYSGFSGYSGKSGYSGISGFSGYSGTFPGTVTNLTVTGNLNIGTELTINQGSPTYTPSYSNPGGSGNRSLQITVTDSGVLDFASGYNDQSLIDGYINSEFFFSGSSASGAWIQFDFGPGSCKLITEVTYYQQFSQSQGTWQIQGSNNGSSWTTISDNFNFGLATPPQVIAVSLSGVTNFTGFRYYRLLGVSGTTNNGPYGLEFTFKIVDIGSQEILQVSTSSVDIGNLMLQPSGGNTFIGIDPVIIDNTGSVVVPGFFTSKGFQVGTTIYTDTTNNRLGVRVISPGNINGSFFVDSAIHCEGYLLVESLSGSTQGAGGKIYMGGYQAANYCLINYNYGSSQLDLYGTTIGGGIEITLSPDGTTTLKTTVAKALNITSANLPTGTLLSPPSLNSGDVWMDTTTSSTYPILRIKV